MSLNSSNTTRRTFVGDVGALATAPAVHRGGRRRRPNILFVISDQWSPVATDPPPAKRALRTPVTDALAAGGIAFRQSYCAYPVCSPARASLFTGRMPHENGVIQNIANPNAHIVPRTMPVMGELFAEAGYATGYFGKEHTGGTAYRGFQHFGSMRYPHAGTIASGAALDPVFVRDAIDFMRTRRENPFLAVVSLINPHDICMVPLRPSVPGAPVARPNPGDPGPVLYKSMVNICDAFDRQTPRYLRDTPMPPLPENFHAAAPAAMTAAKGDYYPPFKSYAERDWQFYIATYYLLMETTDWMIGLLLRSLRDAGLEENTLVVFTSDHGDHMAAHQLPSKSTFYEESVRVPLVLSWKGTIRPGQADGRNLVSGVDVLPTLCDCAGIPVPRSVSGRSLRPLAEGARTSWREFAVSELPNARMLRTGAWKYMLYRGDPPVEFLFDLGRDPGETRNLVEDSGSQGALDKCRNMLGQWMKETGGTLESTILTEEMRRRFRGEGAGLKR